MAVITVDKLAESSENSTILPINGKPTYTMIHYLHKILNSNVASVSTNFGCGMLGQLCLTHPPTVYANLSATLVVPPPNTRATPTIPAGTNGPEAASLQYLHDAATLAFNTFQNMDLALWQHLLGAVEDNIFRVKHRPNQWYSGSSTLDLLTHLYETYVVSTNAAWLTNNKHFCEAYAPTDPIKVVWRHIKDAIAYADAGSTPYSTKQVVDNSYQLVYQHGHVRG